MARVIICDYLKTQIGPGEKTFEVFVDERKFEVGEQGLKALLEQLEGDSPPNTPRVVERIVEREAPPSPLVSAAPHGLEVESQDPFENAPAQVSDAGDGVVIEIPEDTRRRMKPATGKIADLILDQATRFEEGSLPALTMGDRRQREAIKRLKDLEDRENNKLRRRADKGVNVSFDNDYRGK